MAHPFAGQAKSSEAARLKRLTGKAGKAHGSSSMYFKKSYPGGAGTQREYTISGGGSKRRPDKLAGGGAVGGGGGKKRRPHATTNIIISHAGGRGGTGGGGGAGGQPNGPTPVPVPRPVPVPVGAGPAGPVPVRPALPPALPPGGAAPAIPPRPPMGPPGMGPPPVRPPGMKAGGGVKKAARGGGIGDKSMSPGKGYKGFPNSPTTEVQSAVSATKKGGSVGSYARGGAVLKRQYGGGTMGAMGAGAAGQPAGGGLGGLLAQAPGRRPLPEQPSGSLSGVPARPAQANVVPMPNMGTSWMTRPAPGTTTQFAKRGGAVHDDEAEDKALIKKEFKKRGMAAGGLVKTPVTNATGGGAGGKARKAKSRAAKSEPGQTGSPKPGHNPPPRGMAGSKYHQQGHGTK